MKKIYKDFLKKYKAISNYYDYLVSLTKDRVFVGTTNEWIIDNFYLIVESRNYLNDSVKTDKKLVSILENHADMYDIILEIYKKNNYNVDRTTLFKSLNHYQNIHKCYFSYNALRMVPILSLVIIINRIYSLCVLKSKEQIDKEKTRLLLSQIDINKIKNKEKKLDDYIIIDDDILNSPSKIEELNNNLQTFGEDAAEIYIKINNILAKHHITLKELLNKQHINSIEDNMLIANIFASIKTIIKLDISVLYDKTSLTEKLLKQDKIYRNVTSETKGLYRDLIKKKTKKVDEYNYVFSILEKSKEDHQHVGFYLFDEENLIFRGRIYCVFIFIVSIIISWILSSFLLKSRILSFILLLVPISEVVIQITNKVLMKYYKCKPLPKMDYSKEIPRESSTMVVIATIVKDTKKIDAMYKKLEEYYLANNTKNLYFCLLGDCKQHDTLKYEFDEDIAKYGVEIANKLNDKYGKELFYFVYRKRVYNECEQSYLGYERKRGALLHFNKLLLGKLSNEDKQKYVYVETVSNLKEKIKYVITLDTDTELVLNTAQSLVGLMAHPLNTPVLNKAKTKVIKGYGIVQPRVSVDIEATNKSVYSQLMAGIGGFDVYSTIVPNFYQDVFKEGSFVGKGIYDLEVFEIVLENAFPENLILSHDLIEGNYLRCGYASDIELIDDFPAEFLVDSTRQHRWARGDVQIFRWIFSTVKNKFGKNVKNEITPIGKFKIFDNIRRIFLYPCLLLLLVMSYFFSKTNPLYTLLVVVSVIILPLLFYIKEIFQIQKNKRLMFKYYDKLVFGNFALLSRIFITFITIPYNTYLMIDAFFKAMYRMFISHKNLLNWITAEDASKTTGNTLFAYIKAFKVNYVSVILLIIATLMFDMAYMNTILVLSLCFLSAPFILYLVSKHEDEKVEVLSEKQKEKIREYAYRTWQFFNNNLISEYNYLIPDNLQMNREIKEELKTSPTNIGMSLVSIVSAYELDFISKKKALFLINNIIESVESLEKWNGLLFNWYDIKKKEKIFPYDISSVDNGNFGASLIVVKEFAMKLNDENLYEKILNMFEKMDFSTVYTNNDVFSIAYNVGEQKLSEYNYNNFASEARILSFVAIIKGDVPSKHWLSLDKTLTKYKRHKGLVSWSGTSFEYFMPMIFMKSYPNTLLDESYFFAKFCQQSYMEEVDSNMPWGISESAYDKLDDGLNYRYKAFATPYLKAKEDKTQRIVLAPYASILVIPRNPYEVYENLEKFRKLGMYSDYGFYESYDYETGSPVYSYYAHHQGMILSSFTNYLKSNIIQEYFHRDVRVKAFEILLKEKVQLNPIIDLKITGYKKYNYEREVIENDVRSFDKISDIPEISVLSNSSYSLLINDRGNGFSRYQTIQLNRYRKITELDYGNYVYIKDLSNNKIWSNTYAPLNVEPQTYNVVFSTDRIKFFRNDDDISTKTEIIVTKENDAEIRKISFKNNGNINKDLELTTYTEAIIEENQEDISHRAFKNLFIRSEFDEQLGALIMCRGIKSKNISNYMVTKLVTDNSDVTYETERANFIGRNHSTLNPIALEQKNLKNTIGTNIDPVMSLRTTVNVPAGKEVSVYYITGFAKSKNQIIEIINSYDDDNKIEKAFQYSTLANNINTKMLGIKGYQIRLFNIMLNYLYQTSRHFINNERKDILKKNSLVQYNLWKFGISGDRPIMLVDIDNIASIGLVKELLSAYKYYKSRAIYIDLVIINSEQNKYKDVINKMIEQEKYCMYSLFDFISTPGDIYTINRDLLTEEEVTLLNMVARLRFNSRNGDSLEESIKKIQNENILVAYDLKKIEKGYKTNYLPKNIKYYNNYGGFINDGREYVITNPDTPAPWCNVISNKNFGSIISNNGCGFTYAYNSQMYKLSSWTNDMISNDKSEGIKINGVQIDPSIAVHGFGYSRFSHYIKDCTVEVTQFVASEDTIKFYNTIICNTSDAKKKYRVTFWFNPTLGVTEEKTSRYILSEYFDNLNAVISRNVYNPDFSHVSTFISSTLPIISYSVEKILYKSIDIEIELEPNESKNFAFLFGTQIGQHNVKNLIDKYNDVNVINEEYRKVKQGWEEKLSVIKVKTPDESFNYMINGWLLYQSLSSRIQAKAGFYQVGGAFGYRDQLQDTTNLCMLFPELTKSQIITNARHQFKEGDVLHWWHEINRLGLRSKYKDDYLWLVYATCMYITITGDYSILKEDIEFVDGPSLNINEDEKGIIYRYTEERRPLYYHCELALQKAMTELGKNGLPLMGGGDWNDGMNKIGIRGKGTSVWLGFFLYMVINQFIKLSNLYDKNIDVTKYIEFNKTLKQNLNEVAWDKEHYLRAYFDNGNKVGSIDNEECKIDLLSQSFAIISEVIPRERISTVIDSVEQELVDKNLNIIKLLTPPFKNSKDVPGYIMDYQKGLRENGGQYTHATAWYIQALLKSGYIDRGYKYYHMINPINRSLSLKEANKYKVEPYVIAADIYSNKDHSARGGWTWYTGSSGWYYNVGITNIVGFHKEGNRLYFDTKAPSDWNLIEIEYKYKTSTYKIKINLHSSKEGIIVDGEENKKEYITLKNDKRVHAVIVNKR